MNMLGKGGEGKIHEEKQNKNKQKVFFHLAPVNRQGYFFITDVHSLNLIINVFRILSHHGEEMRSQNQIFISKRGGKVSPGQKKMAHQNVPLKTDRAGSHISKRYGELI